MTTTPWEMWFDYQVWLMVQMKFMSPAKMIARGAEMEKWMKMYSLNGVHSGFANLCKPY